VNRFGATKVKSRMLVRLFPLGLVLGWIAFAGPVAAIVVVYIVVGSVVIVVVVIIVIDVVSGCQREVLAQIVGAAGRRFRRIVRSDSRHDAPFLYCVVKNRVYAASLYLKASPS
jgi:hypothetical protein